MPETDYPPGKATGGRPDLSSFSVLCAVGLLVFNFPNLAETAGKWFPLLKSINAFSVDVAMRLATIFPPVPPGRWEIMLYWPVYIFAILGILITFVMRIVVGSGRVWKFSADTLAVYGYFVFWWLAQSFIVADMTGHSLLRSLFLDWDIHSLHMDKRLFYSRVLVQNVIILISYVAVLVCYRAKSWFAAREATVRH